MKEKSIISKEKEKQIHPLLIMLIIAEVSLLLCLLIFFPKVQPEPVLEKWLRNAMIFVGCAIPLVIGIDYTRRKSKENFILMIPPLFFAGIFSFGIILFFGAIIGLRNVFESTIFLPGICVIVVLVSIIMIRDTIRTLEKELSKK